MIKVIDIDSWSWEKHKDNNGNANNYWYENPVLDKFLNDGWTIKDWKLATSKNGSDWTFILEKNMK